jgi:hypothetical protein
MFGRNDFEGRLETPRPVEALVALQYAYPVAGATVLAGPDDGVVSGGVTYCFAGKKTWSDLVRDKKVRVF